jgi:hypothetical protein
MDESSVRLADPVSIANYQRATRAPRRRALEGEPRPGGLLRLREANGTASRKGKKLNGASQAIESNIAPCRVRLPRNMNLKGKCRYPYVVSSW